MSTKIVRVDYTNVDHTKILVSLLNRYACDPMGGGLPLDKHVMDQLPQALAQRHDAISLIALSNDTGIGLLNAFEGFSTFSAKPLINIHDVFVDPQYRGQNISRSLMQAIEKIAVQRKCCKLTLEVLNKNDSAKNAYSKFGFSGYELDPQIGQAVFWQKEIG